MRHLAIADPKTGHTGQIPLDVKPARDFTPEPLPIQGIEVELPLRQAATQQPAPQAMVAPLFGRHGWASPEPPAHCCEIKTGPYQEAGALLAEYRDRAAWLCRWAQERGLIVVPLAAEPLLLCCEVGTAGFIGHVGAKYGVAVLSLCHGLSTQVNTHVPDGAALLALYRGIVRIAPVLAGMFANSPFAGGRRAGVVSYRHSVRRALVNGGDPEQLPRSVSWERYLRSHLALTAMGTWFPAPMALNGMVRLRPERMCVENGVMDLVSEPSHLALLVELTRRLSFRILCSYRDGEPLPPWFLPEDEAVCDAAFRTSMLSAINQGSRGVCCSTEMRPMPIAEVFWRLLSWIAEPGVPEDPSLPSTELDAGVRELLNHGSPAEQMLRMFQELHPDCKDLHRGCPGCSSAIIEICRRTGQRLHDQLAATMRAP